MSPKTNRSPQKKGSSPSGSNILPPPGRQPQPSRHKQKKITAEVLITGGILAAATALSVSLLMYFHPFSAEDIHLAAAGLYDSVVQHIAKIREPETEASSFPDRETTGETLASGPDEESSQETTEISQMTRTDELGDISDMTAETVFPPQDTVYSCMLDSAMGPLFYYNQGDIRWKEYLYGGEDRISKYGCGPVCVAMIINSFSSQPVSPVEMADWSAANGYYARQGGSYHGLIPGSLSAFGLQVESVTERTPEHVSELLDSGRILVALMGKGSLTQNGHFIIIAQLCDNGNVYIADPASYENSTKEWDLQLLMDELKHSYDSGGPLWAVSL